MSENQNEHPHEIIIIKRVHGGDHDEPHGGVWKVAFADFMTAMMAFFLVLWIVNSSSKETRASVARYFNPVQLSDTTPARKGLQTPRPEDFDASVKTETVPAKKEHADEHSPSKASEQPSGGADGKTNDSLSKDAAAAQAETKMFQDPYAALSSIAEKASSARSRPELAQEPRSEYPASASEAFRDPFAPIQLSPKTDAADTQSALATIKGEATNLEKPEKITGPADQPLDKLKSKLAGMTGSGTVAGPSVSLRETSEGTLITLTDQFDYGMFAAGSAEPSEKLVAIMTNIAALLKSFNGGVVIRGHTDGRPFKSAVYDNWRLSSARAYMAMYMLVRGGVPEARIEKVEGYGDHALQNTKRPDAAENRRIEILVRKAAP